MNLRVDFHSAAEVADERLQFAVIAARFEGQWIFCRHKARTTWEIPGGHREDGETIGQAARRELWEETGALEFSLSPVCVYSVMRESGTSFGMLFLADVQKLGELPRNMEIGEITLADELPESLTYAAIQPHLFAKAAEKAQYL